MAAVNGRTPVPPSEQRGANARLGVCVTTSGAMDHLLGVTEAARRAGKETEVFLTAEGVKLTQDNRFGQLVEAADKVWVCEVSFLGFGYNKESVPGLVDRNFSIQARNAEMVERCDRYMVL